MKINNIVRALSLKVISGQGGLENDTDDAYVSDLLSDVIGNAKEKQVWITLQTHQNIIAVASLKEISAIILVKGNMPEADTIEKSNIENIPVLSTDLDTFNIAGRLFELLKMK